MNHQMAARPEASVIICAHDPREDYFRRVMDAMRHQSLSMAKWAFLLVDNASDVSLSSLRDISWHPNARHIREGGTYCRMYLADIPAASQARRTIADCRGHSDVRASAAMVKYSAMHEHRIL